MLFVQAWLLDHLCILFKYLNYQLHLILPVKAYCQYQFGDIWPKSQSIVAPNIPGHPVFSKLFVFMSRWCVHTLWVVRWQADQFLPPTTKPPNQTCPEHYSQAGDFYPGREGRAHVTGSDDGIVITTAASVLELSKRHRELSHYSAWKRLLFTAYLRFNT